MTTRAVVTPNACRGAAIELTGKTGRRVFRKQILPLGQLDYGGRTLRFDKPFLEQVADSFSRRAFDRVPLQLATAQNEHSNDPELTRGVVEDLQFVDGVGLVADVAMSERGAALIEDFPELDVSVRLVENHENSRKDRFDVALQHVCATWDPRVNGMTPWEPVELSNTRAEQVIDLSGLTYARLGRKGAPVAPRTYTPDQVEAAVKAALAAVDTPGNGEFAEPTDAEAEALAGEFFGDLDDAGDDAGAEGAEGAEEGAELVAASREATDAIELSNSRADELERRVLDLTAERDAAAFDTERRRWISEGLPPHVVDLARPALEGRGRTIELSNGSAWDAGAAVRDIFASLVAAGGLVDLSRPVGTAHDGSDQTAQQSESKRLEDAMLSALGKPVA